MGGALALLRRMTRNTPRIIMYHRVIDGEPFISGPSIESFERQIEYIAGNFRVVPIDRLLADWQAGTLESHTMALTFDDAHSDFYDTIWPRLRARQLPATLYVPTGFLDGSLWLWPDKLKYILLNASRPSVDLARIGRFSLASDSVMETWDVLGDHCLQLHEHDRNRLIEHLAALLNVTVPLPATHPFRSVTWEQLREMHAEGLDVGSHSVTHPIFAHQAEDALRYELKCSAERIEEQLGTYPRGICYPNGRLQDINRKVIDCAREAGYEYGLLACDIGFRQPNMFMVPRFDAGYELQGLKWRLAGIDRLVNRSPNFPEY